MPFGATHESKDTISIWEDNVLPVCTARFSFQDLSIRTSRIACWSECETQVYKCRTRRIWASCLWRNSADMFQLWLCAIPWAWTAATNCWVYVVFGVWPEHFPFNWVERSSAATELANTRPYEWDMRHFRSVCGTRILAAPSMVVLWTICLFCTLNTPGLPCLHSWRLVCCKRRSSDSVETLQ